MKNGAKIMRFLDITKAQTIFFKLFEFYLNTDLRFFKKKMKNGFMKMSQPDGSLDD